MTTTEPLALEATAIEAVRADAAASNWRHFADMTIADRVPLTVIERAEGCYLFDSEGRKYLDGISNLFCVNIGYGYGEEIGRAAYEQYSKLPYHSNWATASPPVIELTKTIAELAPEGLNHVYLTISGGESVEAAWKIARQYFSLKGERRWKAIARDNAYHGTTLGALTLNGIAEIRKPFEPLVPSASHVSNTRRFGRPKRETEEEFKEFLLAELEQRIVSEGADTIALVIMEPVQNHGGMLVPPAGYSAGVRALCDKYGILLVADETITGFGRCGAWFASERYEVRPDIITTAKGLSSAHAPIGAVIVTDEIYEVFKGDDGRMFTHGNTFGGHPVMAAVALKNLEIMKRLDIPDRVLSKETELKARLETLLDIPIVVDVRGCGFFYAVELSSYAADGSPFTQEQLDRIYGDEVLTSQLLDRGLILRASLDGGDPLLCVSPPLVADTAEFDLITDVLREVLTSLSADAGLT